MNTIKNLLTILLIALVIGLFIYSIYWVTKNISYMVFYEGMVEQTIRELVKPEYLK